MNELLVHRYVREHDENIPYDIKNDFECVLWYHDEVHFVKVNKKCEYDHDGLIAKAKTSNYDSIYGSVEMPSTSEINIEYEYKVKILKHPSNIKYNCDQNSTAVV